MDSHVPSGCILHSNGAIFQKNSYLALSSLYLGFNGGIFMKIHSLYTLYVHNKWLVKNYLHFTWWVICLPGSISASIGEFFWKLHHALHTHSSKWSKFGCHQSIINGTLLRKQSSTVPWLQLKGSSWKFILCTFTTWATNCADLVPIGW